MLVFFERGDYLFIKEMHTNKRKKKPWPSCILGLENSSKYASFPLCEATFWRSRDRRRKKTLALTPEFESIV
jgi:hypothetical protein